MSRTSSRRWQRHFAADLRRYTLIKRLIQEGICFQDNEVVPISYPGIIRTPFCDGFLDVGATQLFIERALEESGQLSVRGKAQANDLRIRQFCDARAQRFRQDGRETNTLFHSDHAVLEMSSPATQSGRKDEQGHGKQEQP